MRRLSGLAVLLVSALSVAGCAAPPPGSDPVVTVPRTLVPLTLSGGSFVTRQAAYDASVATVDGGFSIRPPTAPPAVGAQFTTTAIVRGSDSLDFGAAGAVSDGQGGIGIGRGPVLERIQAVPQGLELSWTFPSAPAGSGDALVRVRLTGLEKVSANSQSTVLRDTASGAQVRVGQALWVDAKGTTSVVSQELVDGVLTFRVPEALLLSSAYPAVLDPLVSPASIGQVAFDAGVAAGTIVGLDVGISGPGRVTSDDSAIDCGTSGATCSVSYTKDSLVTLTAAATDPGGYFIGWSGLCNGTNPCTVAMSKARFVYAYFEAGTWPVTVVKRGKGKGIVSWNGVDCPAASPTCTFQVPNTRPVRQVARLTAAPDASSLFSGWSVDCGGTGDCTLTVDRPKTAYATFAATTFTVRVEVDETGTVTGSNGITCTSLAPCTFTVPNTSPAQQVTLYTNPSSTFYAWGGSCRGSDTSCTLTVDDDKTVYASWRSVHASSLTQAPSPIAAFAIANQDHTPDYTVSMVCTTCHASNLMAAHNRQCQLCHAPSGPAENLVGVWRNGSCSAGTCHPTTVHPALGQDHFGVYWNSSSSCDLCHTQGGTFPGPADKCLSCHDASTTAAAAGDTTPPVTTSDAQAVYVGGGSIHLSATDVGSGVALTYYFHLAHGRWEVGNDAFIGAVPTSGPGVQYTLQFRSIDHAGNLEAVKSVTYLVKPAVDGVAPVTTSSFNPAAGAIYQTSQPVTLTATDVGSGVQATYYRIDAGPWIVGISFSPPEGLHTFSYYSVDNAGNAETAHVSSSFRIDTIAPVTTCSAVNGSIYTYAGTQSFTLSVTETGSGVASTLARLDAGGWTSGTSVGVTAPASGSASHTISFYSTDVAGNAELPKSVTFTVQAPVVDTTPPTTASSFNPVANAVFKANQPVTLTPTDAASGVKSTWYRIDAGAFAQGTSFTVSGDGLHTFSYYSVDNANNTETTHVSNQFRIDTIAPVTTSTAVNGGSYTGTQTFTFSASDAGSGVASTWYKVDAGAFTAGASVAVAAPASGSASHTVSWYSIDGAGNQEATKTATVTVNAAAAPPPTITLTFKTNWTFSGKSGWDYIYWELQDASGNTLDSFYDDSTSASAKTWVKVVPSGVAYIMYGAFGPAPDGPDLQTATNPVSASQTTPVTWTWQ